MKQEYLSIKCNVTCVATDPRTGRVLDIIKGHNLVTTAGKVLLARMLAEEAGWDTGITYLAIGTGNNAPALTDTTLQTETARKTVASPVYRVSNRLQFKAYFPSADCNVYVKEVALVGHSTATAALNSGELFNRALLSKDNSGGSPVDLTFYVIILVGA